MEHFVESDEESQDEEDLPSSSSTAEAQQAAKPKKRPRPRKKKPKPPPEPTKPEGTTESLQDVVDKLQSLGYSVTKDDDDRSISSQGSRGGGGRGYYRGRGGYQGRGGGRGGENQRGGRGFENEEGNSGGGARGGRGGTYRGRGGPNQGRGGAYQERGGAYRGRGGANQGRGGAYQGRGGAYQGRGGADEGRRDQHQEREGMEDGMQPAVGGDTMEWHIFKQILHRFGGRMPIAKACEVFSSSWDVVQIIDWCRKHQQKFLVFENEASDPTYIGIRHFRCRLCFHYNDRGCRNQKCTYIHVCRAFICGYCAQGPNCTSDHHFESQHNLEILRKMGLRMFDGDDLKKIIQCSNPQVCGMYNNRKSCPYENRCYRLHVCENFIDNKCEKDDCEYAHDFDSPMTQRLLKLFDMERMSNMNILKKNVFVNRRQFEKGPGAGQTRGRGRGRGRGGRGRGSRQGSRQQSRRNSDEDEDYRDAPLREAGAPPPIIPPLLSITDFKKKRTTSSTSSTQDHFRSVDGFGIGEDDDGSGDDYGGPGERFHSYHSSRSSDTSSTRRPTPNAHLVEQTHEDDDIAICVDFVRSVANGSASTCGATCPRHHVRSTYVWQVNVFSGWDTLHEESELIEAAYCDPMQEHIPLKVFTPLLGLENMSLNIHFSSTEKMQCEVLSSGAQTMALKVRRLSTPSGSDPKLPVTKWQWYYRGSGETWHKYEYNAGMELEKAFTQGKLRVNLNIGGMQYRVSFNRWYQLNQATQTKRDICRRPRKFLSQKQVMAGDW